MGCNAANVLYQELLEILSCGKMKCISLFLLSKKVDKLTCVF